MKVTGVTPAIVIGIPASRLILSSLVAHQFKAIHLDPLPIQSQVI
jgi:hypothetical protein